MPIRRGLYFFCGAGPLRRRQLQSTNLGIRSSRRAIPVPSGPPRRVVLSWEVGALVALTKFLWTLVWNPSTGMSSRFYKVSIYFTNLLSFYSMPQSKEFKVPAFVPVFLQIDATLPACRRVARVLGSAQTDARNSGPRPRTKREMGDHVGIPTQYAQPNHNLCVALGPVLSV